MTLSGSEVYKVHRGPLSVIIIINHVNHTVVLTHRLLVLNAVVQITATSNSQHQPYELKGGIFAESEKSQKSDRNGTSPNFFGTFLGLCTRQFWIYLGFTNVNMGPLESQRKSIIKRINSAAAIFLNRAMQYPQNKQANIHGFILICGAKIKKPALDHQLTGNY